MVTDINIITIFKQYKNVYEQQWLLIADVFYGEYKELSMVSYTFNPSTRRKRLVDL